jgi:hypothetical protein
MGWANILGNGWRAKVYLGCANFVGDLNNGMFLEVGSAHLSAIVVGELYTMVYYHIDQISWLGNR